MTQPKKLIEVAMPIKEISAESVRDKSIRHGHISTLHLWWARRPLPVCRAVVFASLVPDPLDENCPSEFADAVEILLGAKNNLGDPYQPYSDIPYTAVEDAMEDNARNRLLMFIGKFSETYIKNGEKTSAKDKLSDASLIKWDNKNDEKILKKARQLIWVSHNLIRRSGAKRSEAKLTSTKNIDVSETFAEPNVSFSEPSTAELLADFDAHYEAIKKAERDLYSTPDRHFETDDVKRKEANLHEAIEAFLDKMPRVFDPFAGGGAIPLEASRLGCRSFGNDINPVAYIIQKGSLEFPQKYGKPIIYSHREFIKRYGEDELKRVSAENSLYASGDKVKIENRLSFDVEFYARELLKRAEAEIGHFYPADEKGKKPIAYYWARVGTCSNPSCRAEVPLLKNFYLANTTNKQVYLKPIIDGNKIDFEIKKGKFDAEGWIVRGNLKCPCCGNPTEVNKLKEQFKNGETSEKILAVIWEGQNGKEYRKPSEEDKTVISQIPTDIERPREAMSVTYTQALPSCTWGLERWGDMFSPRQLLAMQTLVKKTNEIKQEVDIESDYGKAIATYLGILLNRMSPRMTRFGIWDTTRETLAHIFGRQAIPMVFDYPEPNPFSYSGGGGYSQIEWISRYIESECIFPFSTILQNASSGDLCRIIKRKRGDAI